MQAVSAAVGVGRTRPRRPHAIDLRRRRADRAYDRRRAGRPGRRCRGHASAHAREHPGVQLDVRPPATPDHRCLGLCGCRQQCLYADSIALAGRYSMPEFMHASDSCSVSCDLNRNGKELSERFSARFVLKIFRMTHTHPRRSTGRFRIEKWLFVQLLSSVPANNRPRSACALLRERSTQSREGTARSLHISPRKFSYGHYY